MKVLITGASGFLGNAIARALLTRGDQVVALQRGDAPELRAQGAVVVRADLADANAVRDAASGCAAIIHTAAKAGHWGSYQSYFSANVIGTKNVVDAARANGIARLVYTSTPSVAHAGGDLAGVDESTPIPKHFRAHYPATKAIAEAIVLAANDQQLATCALRPHLIWGPGDHHLLPRLIARARAGKLRFVGATSQLIDTIYIDNAVDAHVLALDRLQVGTPLAGRAYFLSNDEPIALDEICNRLIACANLPRCDRRIAYPLAYGVGALMELAYTLLPLKGEPLMTRFLAEQLSTAHWYNISAAKRDLGYRAKISITEGLQRLTAHLANKGSLDIVS
jgi:2-alkyl-3-oxoalkanoate reductase